MLENIKAILKRYDYSFMVGMMAIFLIGVLNLYSATHNHSSMRMQNLYQSQMMWFGVATLVGLIISLTISSKNMLRYSYLIYALNLFLLVLVLILGKKGMGAQRWLVFGGVRFQPSETMKIALVLCLSRFFTHHYSDVAIGLKELIIPGILTMLPAGLIMLQPDLGTGLLLVLIFCVIAFYKMLKFKTILILGVLATISGLLMYNFGLKTYQKKRIEIFLNPGADAKGSGYNSIQSKIAIGSGQLGGKGYLKSSQASLNFLPENHTDFVFSIYNEEHGFFGSILLIALYIILFMRHLWLSQNALLFYESILVIGLMSIFFWHTFINMCMVMGLMPVVGLPLPFMSYGGSSLLTFGICIGLVTSVSNSRNIF